ncbi:raffinose synthase protein [Niveomyces insectorum RCEF 264]|uniref:Raffinose synthase protein n=1 Tax=Niveomyces insectorum RCEF 264 TaxID=1081102 RepID=A0A167UZL3_9HYPO|nr:raffinose synthase protein [Niveomyces insectorum RCEF 264]
MSHQDDAKVEGYSFAAEFAAFLPKKPERRTTTATGTAAVGPAGMGGGPEVAIATYPSLGQVNQVASGDPVTFYAVLETTDNDHQWEVVLWHSAADDDEGGGSTGAWTATQLRPIDDAATRAKFCVLQDDLAPSTVRQYYHAQVRVRGLLHFTVKFRQAVSGGGRDGTPWRWVRDEQDIDDGTVVVNAGANRTSWPLWMGGAGAAGASLHPTTTTGSGGSESLVDLVGQLNPAWSVTSPLSQCPGTQLWALEVTVPGVGSSSSSSSNSTADDPSACTTVALGRPWDGAFLRWLALVRIWTPWLAPRHGRTQLALDCDAVLCAFLSRGGRHLVFLALSGMHDLSSVFRNDEAGDLVVYVRNDSLAEETATVLVAVGDDFESANAAVMYHARSLVQPLDTTADPVRGELKTLLDGFQPQWLEHWYDGLGYCTWNGLGQDLSEAKILHAVDTLAAHGIHIASLIIDDNWQALDRRGDGQFQYGWQRFEADAAQFPGGLAHTVRQLRARHRSTLKHIAVWHALLGYWGGIAPDGELARDYATLVVDRAHPRRRNLPVGGPMTVVAASDVRRFYDDFYRFLADAGVDGVKTDAQFMPDTWTSAAARRTLIPAYQAAWSLAALRHFQGRAIACMAQTPALLFGAQLSPAAGPPLTVRNSDDFFPDVPASHPWHVWTNAYNSLLTQHLNVLPDWDMFQTVHGYSGFHAAARCVSGGPIYITDVPGQHDVDLLRQMTGTAVPSRVFGSDGTGTGTGTGTETGNTSTATTTTTAGTVVFRPSVVGRALDAYTGFHDHVLLLVGSFHGNATTGAGLLGVFNVADRPLRALVPLSRVPGVVVANNDDDDDDDHRRRRRYVARAHSTGRLTGATPVGPDALLPLALGVCAYEIVTVYPVWTFSMAGAAAARAPPHHELHVATLGLVGKMAAAATLVSTACTQTGDDDEDGRPGGRLVLTATLKALGTLGLYVSALPRLTVADNFLATLRGVTIPPHCVAVSAQDAHVLEIDLARAWADMDQAPSYSNEVQLTVYIMVD